MLKNLIFLVEQSMFIQKGYFLTSFLVLLGLLDCFTTVFGKFFLGINEANPIMSALLSLGIPVFIIFKLIAIAFIYISLVYVKKKIEKNQKRTNGARFTSLLWEIALFSLIVSTLVTVINNVVVLFFSY